MPRIESQGQGVKPAGRVEHRFILPALSAMQVPCAGELATSPASVFPLWNKVNDTQSSYRFQLLVDQYLEDFLEILSMKHKHFCTWVFLNLYLLSRVF